MFKKLFLVLIILLNLFSSLAWTAETSTPKSKPSATKLEKQTISENQAKILTDFVSSNYDLENRKKEVLSRASIKFKVLLEQMNSIGPPLTKDELSKHLKSAVTNYVPNESEQPIEESKSQTKRKKKTDSTRGQPTKAQKVRKEKMSAKEFNRGYAEIFGTKALELRLLMNSGMTARNTRDQDDSNDDQDESDESEAVDLTKKNKPKQKPPTRPSPSVKIEQSPKPKTTAHAQKPPTSLVATPTPAAIPAESIKPNSNSGAFPAESKATPSAPCSGIPNNFNDLLDLQSQLEEARAFESGDLRSTEFFSDQEFDEWISN